MFISMMAHSYGMLNWDTQISSNFMGIKEAFSFALLSVFTEKNKQLCGM